MFRIFNVITNIEPHGRAALRFQGKFILKMKLGSFLGDLISFARKFPEKTILND